MRLLNGCVNATISGVECDNCIIARWGRAYVLSWVSAIRRWCLSTLVVKAYYISINFEYEDGAAW